MKYISMTCNKCGADLNIDLDQGYGFCSHCGNKVYADYSDELLIEKEKTKQKRIDLTSQREKYFHKNKIKESDNEDDFSFIILICCIILMIEGSILLINIFCLLERIGS